ncbi:MAG: aminopeptidase P family N-terminal domain-containing protein, partial [Rhodobacteraceae bacterium]|nr:aminopeptidase P family N-terminal domain-containing protein [Paracoccaceae bacterium]
MFQTFDTSDTPEQAAPRVKRLRRQLAEMGISAFLVPRSDRFRGEMVAARDRRLAWLTGFTGSAGICAVTNSKAAVLVDGRYTLQARDEVDEAVFSLLPLDPGNVNLVEWLRMVLDAGSTVGVDGNLHTVNELKTLERRLEEDDIRVVAVENPVDCIWYNQPDPPQGAIVDYPVELAGESDAVKRQRMVKELRWNGAVAAVFTVPSSICWLLNIRGADIPRSPVVHAFAILHSSGRVELFT